jgi:multiple sugar transport system substrate-binding protein
MRKKLLYTFLLFVVLLPLAACGGDEDKKEELPVAPTSAPPTPEDVKEERTTVLFAVNDVEQPLYEGLVESFKEANPDVHVELVSLNEILELDLVGGEFPEDAWQRLASQADVINLMPGQETVQQGLIRDLTPLMQADPNFEADDFYPNALERSQWEGGTWSLPTRTLFDMIYYDKDAFDEAGVPYPETGWSWDDFLAAARGLTIREGDAVTRWGFVQPWANHWMFVEGRVGPVIDRSTEPPTPRLDQPEVTEAIRWYVDLYLKEEVTSASDEVEGALASQGQTLVESGEAPMWHDWFVLWAYRKEQGNRGIVPYPVDTPDSHSTMIWTSGVSMSAGTAHPEAAWRWMDFLTRQDISEQGPLVRFLPPRRSVAETGGFWDDIDPELADALRYALDHSYVLQQTAGYEAISDVMEPVLLEEKPLEDALIEAQAEAEAEIQEAQVERAEATPVPTVVVAAPEEKSPAAEGAVTVVFNVGTGVLSMQAYRDAAQRFHEAHPDIVVEVQMPNVTDTSITMRSVAESADCFQWVPQVKNPGNQAAILSLEPFMDADPSFSTDDFYPPVLEKFAWQGQLWGLPLELRPYVVEYNKALFDTAGLDYPAQSGGAELFWTTDDFVELAAALTQGEDEAKQYGFVPQALEVNDLLLLIEPRGARLIDLNADPPAFTLDDPSTAEALRWYADMSTAYGVKPIFVSDIAKVTEISAAAIEREGLISEGRVAMWTNLGSNTITGDREDLDIGVAPLPAGTSGATASGTATGYFISAQTEVRQACWLWINFLTQQPGLTEGLPARRSVAETDGYREQVGDERADVYLASVAGAERASVFDTLTGEAWLAGGIYWLGRAYDQVVNEQASVEAALDAAQNMAEDYRACVIVDDAISDEAAWQACMQEVDPSLPAFLFNQGENQ